MDKTPIRELIDYCANNKRHHHCDSIHNPIEYLEYKDIIGELSRILEKEKQFCFDCFEAGKQYGIDGWNCIVNENSVDHPDFDAFYEQYTQQQKQ